MPHALYNIIIVRLIVLVIVFVLVLLLQLHATLLRLKESAADLAVFRFELHQRRSVIVNQTESSGLSSAKRRPETEQNNGFRVAHLHALSKVLHERRFGHVGLAGVQDLDNLVLYVRVFV